LKASDDEQVQNRGRNFGRHSRASLLGGWTVILVFLLCVQAVFVRHPLLSGSRPLEIIELRLVTMNIAMMEPSEAAPSDWTTEKQQQVLLDQLLGSDPDILCIQECPQSDCMEQAFPHLTRIMSKPSHMGYTSLFVKKNFTLTPVAGPRISIHTPAVIATFLYQDHPVLAIASVHLKPFKTGSVLREQQVKELISAADDEGIPLLFAGDTNMRDSEDSTMEKTFDLKDIWREAGAEANSQYTWDTIDHRREGGAFNQYYGSSTRQYQRRYDRIYVHGANVSVTTFELLANRPIGSSKDHFLSDHFGISAQIKIVY